MTRARPRLGRIALAALWLAAIAGLLALAAWQIQRRSWKLALIARVEAGLHAAPVAPPAVARPDDAYRRIAMTGRFIPARDTFVQASTVRGPGFWVLTPFRTSAGPIVLVNRGYVPRAAAASPDPTAQRVTGLLRLTEPGGGFLRHNRPAADRWYSRDVSAIAARRGLASVAPFFVDADADPGAVAAADSTVAIDARGDDATAAGDGARRPVGGLTVVRFTNNHLVYAITWSILALITGFGFVRWIAPAHGPRRARPADAARPKS